MRIVIGLREESENLGQGRVITVENALVRPETRDSTSRGTLSTLSRFQTIWTGD